MNTNVIVNELKDNDQDFEWYPTTKEMLRSIAVDLKREDQSSFSMLDIGAGNGQVFNIIRDVINVKDKYGDDSISIKKYAIEKSRILIDKMPNDVFVIGSDFLMQTLIDKKVDVIFCNPPYKEYLVWMEKIIKEANCRFIYLVVPERWKDNKHVIELIKKRSKGENSFKILGSHDFINSEFRTSRSKIDIVKIDLSPGSEYHRENNPATDPFNIWFSEHFKINADENNYTNKWAEKKSRSEEIKEIVDGNNLIERLEELYKEDMKKLLSTYKSIENLDYQLLKELEVNLDGVKEALKMKIKGLKDLYWHELFDNLGDITKRLTSDSKKNMLENLNNNTNIDYSCENAYAVVIWAIKNANKYFDSQLVNVYKSLTTPEAVKNYKSNKNIISDDWRYCRYNSSHTKYTLDYRIVVPRHCSFNQSSYGGYDYPNGLSRSTHDFINDILVIGNNLGFIITGSSYSFQWTPGSEKKIIGVYNNSIEPFLTVRAYKNGNLHFKFSQLFMTAFNIEASRINGWVKSPAEMTEETGIKESDVCNHFQTNKKFKSIKLLK